MTTIMLMLVLLIRLQPLDDVPGKLQSPEPDLPKFLTEKEFSCAMFAEAINHFVDMGEEKAIAAIKELAAKPGATPQDLAIQRLAFTCRSLFEPKGKVPLRAPPYGGLLQLPERTMPLEKWPLYPVVRSGSSYFVLSERYSLGGKLGPTISYFNYCFADGKFRKDRVPVPSKEQALRDIDLLRESEPWKALKWKDKGQGFDYEKSESTVLNYLKAQAEKCPSK